MDKMAKLTARRGAILEEIESIQSMRKGTLNATYKKVVHKDGDEVMKGPYYRLSCKDKKSKTLSWTVSVDEVDFIQEEVSNYRRFRQLADDYVSVCEEISLQSQAQGKDSIKKN